MPPSFCHPYHFAHGLTVVGDVFKHLIVEYEVKGIGSKGEMLADGLYDPGCAIVGLNGPFVFQFGAKDLLGVAAKGPRIHTQAAADVEDSQSFRGLAGALLRGIT